jgi:hypothetical protein
LNFVDRGQNDSVGVEALREKGTLISGPIHPEMQKVRATTRTSHESRAGDGT